jgi:hypothetical protein
VLLGFDCFSRMSSGGVVMVVRGCRAAAQLQL